MELSKSKPAALVLGTTLDGYVRCDTDRPISNVNHSGLISKLMLSPKSAVSPRPRPTRNLPSRVTNVPAHSEPETPERTAPALTPASAHRVTAAPALAPAPARSTIPPCAPDAAPDSMPAAQRAHSRFHARSISRS